MKWLLPLVAFLLFSSPAAAAAAFAPQRFTVEVVGTGPDVILIPGLASSPAVWRASVAAVPGYRYHLVHVAGFAGSAARANARGEVVAPLAEEIARYIEAQKLDRPAIVGHSMGGTLALMLAARHPDRIGRAMAVDILPQPAGLIGASAGDMRGLTGALRSLGIEEQGRGLFLGAIRLFGGPSPGDARSDPDVVARSAQELALADLTPELRRIRAPLTIVYAAPLPSLARAVDRAFADAYAPARGARLVRIDGSGHMVMHDQPARFAEALKAFLAR
jgi:pimeloyl-ACP methyl ester carboxylesterase